MMIQMSMRLRQSVAVQKISKSSKSNLINYAY